MTKFAKFNSMISRVLLPMLIALSLTACEKAKDAEILNSISSTNKLTLLYRVWQKGDDAITLYRKDSLGPIFAEIDLRVTNFNESEEKSSKKGIQLTAKDEKIVVDCISELFAQKMTVKYKSPNYHYSQIVLEDSSYSSDGKSLVIYHELSPEWINFEKLKASLLFGED